jgi:hypothetical protein
LQAEQVFVRIPDFGHYLDEPDVRSFGRDL